MTSSCNEKGTSLTIDNGMLLDNLVSRKKNNNRQSIKSLQRKRLRQSKATSSSFYRKSQCIPFIIGAIVLMLTVQMIMNSLFSTPSKHTTDKPDIIHNRQMIQQAISNPYIPATSSHNTTTTYTIQQQLKDLQRQIQTMESKSQIYVENPLFFPFVIRDSRHLVPTQTSDEFHIFDYVDITQPKQSRSKHSQLFHNAQTNIGIAPCQSYSIQCYRYKIIQVFDYILTSYPIVEYYFYMEADNDLCVPMTKIQDLALDEKRYFINVGIGFSGWIMSRQFMMDFLTMYKNVTNVALAEQQIAKQEQQQQQNSNNNNTNSTTEEVPKEPEIRPDVLASYYLTEKHAWTVTRQYWVSHTTLESLGIASLTVKDRRRKDSGQRLKLDKHLPRCFEPRRGKWKISKTPYDPRDRFGWDYFDYDVCPNSLLFPCEGPNQLEQLVAQDLRIANQTGAIAKAERVEKVRKKRREAAAAAEKKRQEAAADEKAAEKSADEKEKGKHLAAIGNRLEQIQAAGGNVKIPARGLLKGIRKDIPISHAKHE